MSNIKTKFSLEIEFEIEGTYQAGDPGKTYGPPEKCYPPEPEFIEVSALSRIGIPVREAGGWVTRWLKVPEDTLKHVLELIVDNSDLLYHAEDAIRDEANGYD